jgi:hypothetical protein
VLEVAAHPGVHFEGAIIERAMMNGLILRAWLISVIRIGSSEVSTSRPLCSGARSSFRRP